MRAAEVCSITKINDLDQVVAKLHKQTCSKYCIFCLFSFADRLTLFSYCEYKIYCVFV